MLKAFEFADGDGAILSVKESDVPETVIIRIEDDDPDSFLEFAMKETDWLDLTDLKYKIHCKKAPKPAPEPEIEKAVTFVPTTHIGTRTAGEEF